MRCEFRYVLQVYGLCLSPEIHSDIRGRGFLLPVQIRPVFHRVAISPQCPGRRQSAAGDEGQRSLRLCLGDEHGHRVLLRRPGGRCVALALATVSAPLDRAWASYGPGAHVWPFIRSAKLKK